MIYMHLNQQNNDTQHKRFVGESLRAYKAALTLDLGKPINIS